MSHGCISTAVLQHFFHTQCHLSNQRFTNCICYQRALDLIIPCWDFPVSAQEDREQSKSREKKCQFQAWSWRRTRAHSSALVVLINASTPNLSLSHWTPLRSLKGCTSLLCSVLKKIKKTTFSWAIWRMKSFKVNCKVLINEEQNKQGQPKVSYTNTTICPRLVQGTN